MNEEHPPLLRDRYELRELLGRGGQGEVHRAWDHLHHREVALKIRPAGGETERASLLSEARILLGLSPHPGVPLVRDDFFDGDRYVLVMDFVQGTPLDVLVEAQGDPGLVPSVALDCLSQAAAALDHLHAHDPPVVHGDVKPANLVRTRDGRVVLVDFGVAGNLGRGGGGASGTPGYVPPEVASGAAPSVAADVYGLAATAVALLSGQPPSGVLPAWEGIPPALAGKLERALRRGLAGDPRRRPPSAGVLVERLRSFLTGDLPSGLVTFWCTAVPGSAGLWERDAEAVSTALARYVGIVADAAEASSGHLVKTGGEGEATLSVFATATDALRAACAARDAFAREDWPEGLSLPVGMALHSGEVVARNGDYHGPAVNRARRLCAIARPGQVVLSAVTSWLVADSLPAGMRLADLGERRLDDLSRPERVFAFGAGEAAAAAAATAPSPAVRGLPLPARLVDTNGPAFVGREAELEVLASNWRAVASGAHRVVLLAGESGMGKTRLVTEVARAAHAQGARVLYGHCDEDHDVPYQPFTEALRGYVAACPVEELADHVEAHGGELVRLVPELSRRMSGLPAPAPASPETERYRLFDTIAALLAQAARHAPVVLVLEDLHWAGKPALLLLRHLVTSPELAGVLAIGTYRENELDRHHPLTAVLADLRRGPAVTRLALTGLSEAETAALAELTVGHDLDHGRNGGRAGLVRTVWGETEGAPFFVVEMLRHLAESGALARPLPGGPNGLPIPDSVREVVGQRVARQPAVVGAALELAAVIGREFDVTLLQRVADVPEDELFDALDQAAHAALVGEVPGRAGRFCFAHSLVRGALYEDLGANRRKRLHRKVAEALEGSGQSGVGVEEVAHHWFEAYPMADGATVVAACRRSGDAALERLAYEEAAAHYGRALSVLDRQGDAGVGRTELLVRLGDAQRRAGDTAYRQTMTAAAGLARRLGAAEQLALAALGSSRPGTWYMGIGEVDAPLVALYEEAITALGEAADPLRARLLAQLAVELYWTPDRDRRVALSDEAVATARRVGDPATLAQVLLARFVALSGPLLGEEMFPLTAELTGLADELGNLETAFLSRLIRTIALVEAADWDGALPELDAAVALAGRLRQPFFTWLAGTVQTMLALLRDAATAESDVASLFVLGQQCGDIGAAHVFGSTQSLIRWDQGRIAEMIGAIEAFAEATPRIPAWKAVLTVAYVEDGRTDDARALFETLAVDGFDLPRDWVWTVGTALLGEACAHLGDVARAKILYDRLLPLADGLVVCANGIVCLGATSRVLGCLAATLGRFEAAEAHFEHAMALNTRIGARSFLVRTRRAYAAMLLDRGGPGDAERAAAEVEAGLALAGELGMALELRRLGDLTRRSA